jgi:hypothetical protein
MLGPQVSINLQLIIAGLPAAYVGQTPSLTWVLPIAALAG